MGVVKLSTAGILDYQKYSNFLAGNAPVSLGAYDLLETEILTGTQSSVTFSSLNSTYGSDYQHLQIRFTARSNTASDNDNFRIQLNTDTGTNYASHRLYGNGTSVLANGYPSEDYMRNMGVMPAATSAANVFNGAILDILDPFETTKYTTIRVFAGMTDKTLLGITSGLWMNTSAVDSILIDGLSGSFVQYSRFSLYGLKN